MKKIGAEPPQRSKINWIAIPEKEEEAIEVVPENEDVWFYFPHGQDVLESPYEFPESAPPGGAPVVLLGSHWGTDWTGATHFALPIIPEPPAGPCLCCAERRRRKLSIEESDGAP